jgi:predicted dehydrogenase
MDNKVKVALYGSNGHQIAIYMDDNPYAELVAVCDYGKEKLPDALKDKGSIKEYASLDEMLEDQEIELISLCSAKRSDQAEDTIKCLKHGKHVYAEKPCALTETDLDRIIQTSRSTGKIFHEMASTAFEQPYLQMQKIIREGTIGNVVQVLAQKSYPYHENRPKDEKIDGGLMCQVGVHATRFVEHVTGLKITEIISMETDIENHGHGDLRSASAMMMRLENGGIASIISNYLNPPAFPSWGNETLRVFGTKGFIEAVDGGTRKRLVLNDKDCGEFEITEKLPQFHDMIFMEIRGEYTMPLSLEDEIHPTRMVIRAKEQLTK